MTMQDPQQPQPMTPPPIPVADLVPWEYVTQTLNVAGFFTIGSVNAKAVNDALNWYGAQGWELVAAVPDAGATGGTVTLILIFKRPKPIAS